MVSKDEDKYVIWPSYFDNSLSRREGRKLSKKYAVDKPSLELISKAAKSLGLNPILEKNCKYPAKHWKTDGRILIDKKDTKLKLIRLIVTRI